MKVNTLVVGGGISGLTTAYELSKQGLDVCVIEKDQIGGRIYTYHNDKNDIRHDMGAEYFISTDQALMKLIDDLDLPIKEYLDQRAVYDRELGRSMVFPSDQDSFLRSIIKKVQTMRYLGLSNLYSASKLQSNISKYQDKLEFMYQSITNKSIDNIYTEVSEEFKPLATQTLKEFMINEGYSTEFIYRLVEPMFQAIYMKGADELTALFGLMGFAAKTATLYQIKNGNHNIIKALVSNLDNKQLINGKCDKISKEQHGYTITYDTGTSHEIINADFVYLAIPHTALNSINFINFSNEEMNRINKLKSIPYNSAVFHHLIEGKPREKIKKLFEKGADTVYIAKAKDIFEINKLQYEEGRGLFDITSNKRITDTNTSVYFTEIEHIKSKHWKNAYPEFTPDYFEELPQNKINNSLYGGADSYVSTMGNAVLFGKLIAEKVSSLNESKETSLIQSKMK